MISDDQARSLVATMEDGWNAADGTRYSEPFAADADFVTVAGMHLQGRQAIADSHDRIFSTVYKGSRVAMRLADLRPINDETALMHVAATLNVPSGSLSGTMNALMTIVVSKTSGKPEIAALHNTIVRNLAQAAGRPGQAKGTTA
jgi:uncharacterized protein (TIGR02246 family)